MARLVDLYSNDKKFFKAFNENDKGQLIWEQAQTSYPKYKTGNNDTEKAIKDIFSGMMNWLYSEHPDINDIDIAAFLDTHEFDLRKSIFLQLTKK